MKTPKIFRKQSPNRLRKKISDKIAIEYLAGNGIEIGALHNKMPVSRKAKVSYVDRISYEDLIKHYPELKGKKITKPDIVSDAQTLGAIADNSQDFIIASHILEHCEDPIEALKNFSRVMKQDANAYIIVPDKRHCFDHKRPLTSVEHLVKDHEEGVLTSRRDHYLEWLKLVEDIEDEEEIAKKLKTYEETNYNIHFHVWDTNSFLNFLNFVINEYELLLEIVLYKFNYNENALVLRKTD